jgi:hypothetical protein
LQQIPPSSSGQQQAQNEDSLIESARKSKELAKADPKQGSQIVCPGLEPLGGQEAIITSKS